MNDEHRTRFPAGFKREGIQRDGYYYNHAYHDFVMMSILEDEFREIENRANRTGGACGAR